MANIRHEVTERFIAVSGIGKQQTAQGVPLANVDLDTRDKCQIVREDVVARRTFRDCRDEDLIDSVIDSRFARYTLTYNEVTPQIISRWLAYFYGVAAAPVGTPVNKVYSLSQSGTVTGGTFTITVSMSGRSATTKPLPYNATLLEVQQALTAPRMRFITPMDIQISGTDVASGLNITFIGRLAASNDIFINVDDSAITGGGNIASSVVTPGNQYTHVISRSPFRDKPFVSFAIGYDSEPTRVEKYADFVVDSVQINAQLDGNVSMSVVLVGLYDYASIESSFTIPDCQNITPLRSQEVDFIHTSYPQTTDLQSLQISFNDNVPTDRLSAFAFDGIEIQRLRRGRQPSYGANATIFASEQDAIYTIAEDEYWLTPQDVNIKLGFGGNQVELDYPNAELQFQTTRWTEVGEAGILAIQVSVVPFASGAQKPVSITSRVNQSTAFLTT